MSNYALASVLLWDGTDWLRSCPAAAEAPQGKGVLSQGKL